MMGECEEIFDDDFDDDGVCREIFNKYRCEGCWYYDDCFYAYCADKTYWEEQQYISQKEETGE